jgi:hypothetical protein
MKNFTQKILVAALVLTHSVGFNKRGWGQTQIINMPPGNQWHTALTMTSPACPEYPETIIEISEAGTYDALSTGFNELFFHYELLAGRYYFGYNSICKKAGSDSLFYVMKDDGAIDEFVLRGCPPKAFIKNTFKPLPANYPSDPNAVSIQGDKIYVQETGWIETTVDSGNTWVVDTVGLGGNCLVSCQAIDTYQNAYVLSNLSPGGSLFMEAANSSTWAPVTGYTGGSNGTVWIDNKNTIWINSGSYFYYSTNGGISFTQYTSPDVANGVTSICDDAFGNVYAMNGKKMYRSADSGNTWTRIGTSISNKVYDTIAGSNTIFNSISADSIVTVTTNYGFYNSWDQGNTWDIDSVPAQTIWGYQQYPDGRKVISTPLATYLQQAGNTTWTQTYPVGNYYPYNYVYNNKGQNGPLPMIQQDYKGHLFMGTSVKNGSTSYVNVRSNDSGATWVADTAGFGAMGGVLNGYSAYYVDSMGTQYAGWHHGGVLCASKTLSGAWIKDTLGMGVFHPDQIVAFADAHGYIYAAGYNNSNGFVLKRPVTGNTWVADTTGLSGAEINVLSKNSIGDLMGAAPVGIDNTEVYFRASNTGTWAKRTAPPVSGNGNVQSITGNNEGGWIAYTNFFWGQTNNFPYYNNYGAYCSTDSGASWNLVALDSVYINQLETIEDTVFALTDVGLYKNFGCNPKGCTLVIDSVHINSEVSCNGGNNGSATVTLDDGESPYTYSWSDGETSSTAHNLSAGSDYVIVRDAKGCSEEAHFAITQPATALTLDSVHIISEILCYNNGNGSAVVIASGGETPYTYGWFDAETTDTAYSLGAGFGTVHVTDHAGCTEYGYYTITQPATAVSISIASQTNMNCYGYSTGSATANAAMGGTPPYSYSWSNSLGTNLSVSGLSAGTYYITALDSNGCNAMTSVTITQPGAFTISIASQTNINCYGNSTGAATANVPTGGASPYTYNWSNSLGTNLAVSGLSAGTYTITATDNNGCNTSTSITISQPAAQLAITIASQTNVNCYGNSTGGATANTPTGGTSPYTYSWSSGGTNLNTSNLSAGTYTITATDNNGCTAMSSVSITQPTQLTLSKSSTNDMGPCNGTAKVTASGGTVPYTYLWTPGNETTDSIGAQCAGTYCCAITDNNGCMDSICLVIDLSTGITVLNNTQGITIYPNPSKGQFTIQSFVVNGECSVEVYNILGENVLTEPLHFAQGDNLINLTNQPNGVYFYRVLIETGALIGEGKVVIEK